MSGSKKIILGLLIGSFIVLFIVFFVIGIVGMMSDRDGSGWAGFGDKIGIVEVKGQIYASDNIVYQLRSYASNSSVKGILLRINSPGGVVGASQEIYDEVLRVRQDYGIPVVVSMGSVAASGGYYIACAGDYIYANPGTMTGSIGVIMQYPVVKDLADKVGIQFQTIKSGRVKDVGNPYREPNEADSLMLSAVINDTYDQFVEAIATNRNLDREKVLEAADGSIYSGRQALELGLVDALGSYETAIEYLAEISGFSDEPRRLMQREKRERNILDLIGSLADEYLKPLKSAAGPQLLYLYR